MRIITDCMNWGRRKSNHNCRPHGGVDESIIEDVRIILSASWVALMLTYLLGDVLRIYSGDFAAGKIGGIQITGNQWLGVAILMVPPIVMMFLSLTLNYPVTRWANIIVAIVFFGFNLMDCRDTLPLMTDS